MKNIAQNVFIAVLVVAVLGLMYWAARLTNERDRFERSTRNLTSSYTVHLVAEYRKGVCGLNVANNSDVENAAAFTDKDRACLAGVIEKARKEIATIKE